MEFADLASSFLPYEDRLEWNEGEVYAIEQSTRAKVMHCALEVFRTIAIFSRCALLSIAKFPVYAVRTVCSISSGKKEEAFDLPISSAQELADALPEKVGFSDSFYQTVGLGTKYSAKKLEGTSNWDKWLTPEHIEGGEQDYHAFFTDVLSDPVPFVEILRSMGSTAYRFSLEWSVIEIEPGRYNPEAIAIYKNFIRELQQAGIEPYCLSGLNSWAALRSLKIRISMLGMQLR
jgi:hypothetical protein